MNTTELVNAIAARTQESPATVERVLNGVREEVVNALRRGDKVTLNRFLHFSARQRAARVARNPRTGEAVDVPAKLRVAVRAASAMHDQL